MTAPQPRKRRFGGAGWMAGPGRFAARRPWLGGLLVLGLLAATLAFLPRLGFDDDLQAAFANDRTHSARWQKFLDETGGLPLELLVLAESPEAIGSEQYSALADLAFEIAFLGEEWSVVSPFSLRFPDWHPRFPGEPLFPFEGTPGEAALAERVAAFRALDLGLRPLVTPDLTRLLIVASAPPADPETTRARMDAVAAVVDAASVPGVKLTLAGEPMVGPAIVKALRHDLLILNALGIALAVGTALLLFRTWRLVVMVALPAVAAAGITLGVYLVLGFQVTVVNAVIPMLVLVLALADAVHLARHMQGGTAPDPRARLDSTLDEVGPACGLTAATTAVAFAAIWLSDNAQLRDMATIGAVTVMVAYVVVLVAFAALARALAPPRSRPESRLDPPPWLLALPFERPRAVLAVALLATVLGGLGAARLTPWFNIDENLPRTSELARANDVIGEHFGGIFRLWAEVPLAPETPEGWQRLTAVTDAFRTTLPEATTLSLVTVARFLGQPETAPDRTALDGAVPEPLLQRLAPEGAALARAVVTVPDPMTSRTTLARQDAAESAALEAGAGALFGTPMILRHESLAIIGQMLNGLVLATIACCLVVAAAFRRLWLAAVLLLPNGLPLLLTAAALLPITGGRITATAVVALTVSFGIAIDDSIHVVNRYYVGRKAGLDRDGALRLALRRTGGALVVTTLVICVGMAATAISAFDTIRLFGTMLAITFVTALVTDLLLLPVLLRYASRR